MTAKPERRRNSRPRRQAEARWAAHQQTELFNLPLLMMTLPSLSTSPQRDEAQLRALVDGDQKDRQNNQIAAGAGARDRMRRSEVLKRLAQPSPMTANDMLSCALILQHGPTPEHYYVAFELARRAMPQEPARARWLMCAAMDRWLMNKQLPQKYGTQYVDHGRGWELYEWDSDTTDQEREDWGVPPIEEALRRAIEWNEQDRIASQDP